MLSLLKYPNLLFPWALRLLTDLLSSRVSAGSVLTPMVP